MTLPFTWQGLYDWFISRHHQPAEAYDEADRLWKSLAPMILAQMTDAEVEEFAAGLSAEFGVYDGRPNITEREFPRCLDSRLHLIERRKKWVGRHQGPTFRIVHQEAMVALHVKSLGDQWRWEMIHGSVVDTVGSEKTETEAWAKAEGQWQISQARLLNRTHP